MAKKSFWQKISSALTGAEYEEYIEEFEDIEYQEGEEFLDYPENEESNDEEQHELQNSVSMELPLDVYHDDENIYIEAFIPGVPLNEIDIELSRDLINIRGTRKAPEFEDEKEYFYKELKWGDFERSLVLPEEVDIDAAEAIELNGVLKITLPKFNKSRKAKLTVKSARK